MFTVDDKELFNSSQEKEDNQLVIFDMKNISRRCVV